MEGKRKAGEGGKRGGGEAGSRRGGMSTPETTLEVGHLKFKACLAYRVSLGKEIKRCLMGERKEEKRSHW